MKPNILVVDDDEIIWVLIRKMLIELGLVNQLTTFADGEPALEYLQTIAPAEAPHLILLDLNLPVVDGFSFLEVYQREHVERLTGTQICILTSSVWDEDRQHSLAYPFVRDFVSKPLRIERLKEVLQNIRQYTPAQAPDPLSLS